MIIAEFTKDSLTKIAATGVEIAMVQIGNETTGGLCGETTLTYSVYATITVNGVETTILVKSSSVTVEVTAASADKDSDDSEKSGESEDAEDTTDQTTDDTDTDTDTSDKKTGDIGTRTAAELLILCAGAAFIIVSSRRKKKF